MASDITDDEFTVLGIAKEGQSMMPIGRWEQPIKALAEKGLMHCADAANYQITDKGRNAWAARDSEDDGAIRQLLESNNKVANARTQAQQSTEQAALHLSFAAKASALVTGQPPEFELREWGRLAMTRALEIIANG